MGFRTVVMLNNDQSSKWMNDAELGRKIALGMSAKDRSMSYGSVVECVHADTQTLAVLDMYTGFKALSYSGWNSGQNDEDVALRLLKEAAEKLGYRLAKKPVTLGY